MLPAFHKVGGMTCGAPRSTKYLDPLLREDREPEKYTMLSRRKLHLPDLCQQRRSRIEGVPIYSNPMRIDIFRILEPKLKGHEAEQSDR